MISPKSTDMDVGNCEFCGAENSPVFKVYRSCDNYHCICEKCYNKRCMESAFNIEREWGGKEVKFNKVAGESVYFVPCHCCGKLTKGFRYRDIGFKNAPLFTHECYICEREKKRSALLRRVRT